MKRFLLRKRILPKKLAVIIFYSSNRHEYKYQRKKEKDFN